MCRCSKEGVWQRRGALQGSRGEAFAGIEMKGLICQEDKWWGCSRQNSVCGRVWHVRGTGSDLVVGAKMVGVGGLDATW